MLLQINISSTECIYHTFPFVGAGCKQAGWDGSNRLDGMDCFLIFWWAFEVQPLFRCGSKWWIMKGIKVSPLRSWTVQRGIEFLFPQDVCLARSSIVCSTVFVCYSLWQVVGGRKALSPLVVDYERNKGLEGGVVSGCCGHFCERLITVPFEPMCVPKIAIPAPFGSCSWIPGRSN